MKFYLILGLLWLSFGTKAEKKINLEDIERDNLRAEGASKSGNPRTEGPRYTTNAELTQQYYRVSSQGSGVVNSQSTYVTPASIPSETYTRPTNYATKEQTNDQQRNNILSARVLPPQYYNEYQQQSSLTTNGIIPSVYQTQQSVYRPELNVDNQLFSYENNPNKDTVYVDIPVMQLLAYYPNLHVSSGKSATTATEHVSVPVYPSTLTQKPIVAAKPAYRLEYASKYKPVIPSALTDKTTKSSEYTNPVTSIKLTGSSSTSMPSYVSHDQSYAQGRQLLYTQAYTAPSQPRYISGFVYGQPITVYMHATPVYRNIYTATAPYARDNYLHGNTENKLVNEQSNIGAPAADELASQVLAGQSSQSVSHNDVKDIDEPSADLVPPRSAAHNFESRVTPVPLLPVSSQEEQSVADENHLQVFSEARSLLDSYVPSRLIAAQDSARYQERPIRLESGFLPSKVNFFYKKRKID